MYCIILIARTQGYTAKFKMASSKCAILDLAASQRVVDFDQVFELVVESSDDAESDENNVSEPQLNNEEAIIQTLGSVLTVA